MKNKFHYILVFFVVVIIYLIYLISKETYGQFQVDVFIENTQKGNLSQKERNKIKQAQNEYNHTNAYNTLVAKSSQGKYLDGEVVIHIVGAEEMSANSAEETRRIILENQKKLNNPLRNMNNPQKWNFILTRGLATFKKYNN
ncbi:hypothetical protein KGV55_03215 [Candidatus Gracilibacteria bacterium]|nr:hypothetical protein [Candidatus Gracilibacteria bacterium]